MNRPKLWISFLALLILSNILSAFNVKDPRRELSKQLGIDLMNDGTVLLHETDTIGWFGDGYILSELECSDESVLNDIMNDEHWKRLPLSENMHRFFYEDYHFPNDLPIPVIKEGYYFFYDRHDQAKDPSAKMEVPEKWEIPGMERIGESFAKEYSSIFLSISLICLFSNSICSSRCLI